MPDYANGKIYRIVGNGLTYIGSTCCTLRQRLAKHVSNYRDFINNGEKYMSSFDIIKNGNYDIILIEDYPCERREKLLMRERYYIENMECVNNRIPLNTVEERKEYIKIKQKRYVEKNSDLIKNYNKTYRENNLEVIKEKQRLKRLENIELSREKERNYKRKEYIKRNDVLNDRHKTYYNDKKETITTARKQKYNLNKDEINTARKQKYNLNKDEINKMRRLKTFLNTQLKLYNI